MESDQEPDPQVHFKELMNVQVENINDQQIGLKFEGVATLVIPINDAILLARTIMQQAGISPTLLDMITIKIT